VNIGSISSEIGLTLKNAAPQSTSADSSSGKSAHSAPLDSIKAGQSDSQDLQHAPQPVVNGQELSLEFSVDKDTHTQVIKVIDRKSGDVVRQIPPEEVLNFLRQFEKFKGLIVSRRI
jgi:uncharacterized FlaG/YvyC family protein